MSHGRTRTEHEWDESVQKARPGVFNVAATLKRIGYQVELTPEGGYQDRVRKLDGFMRRDGYQASLQVKADIKGEETSNLAIEIEHIHEDGSVEPGWFYTRRANLFFSWVPRNGVWLWNFSDMSNTRVLALREYRTATIRGGVRWKTNGRLISRRVAEIWGWATQILPLAPDAVHKAFEKTASPYRAA